MKRVQRSISSFFPVDKTVAQVVANATSNSSTANKADDVTANNGKTTSTAQDVLPAIDSAQSSDSTVELVVENFLPATGTGTARDNALKDNEKVEFLQAIWRPD